MSSFEPFLLVGQVLLFGLILLEFAHELREYEASIDPGEYDHVEFELVADEFLYGERI